VTVEEELRCRKTRGATQHRHEPIRNNITYCRRHAQHPQHYTTLHHTYLSSFAISFHSHTLPPPLHTNSTDRVLRRLSQGYLQYPVEHQIIVFRITSVCLYFFVEGLADRTTSWSTNSYRETPPALLFSHRRICATYCTCVSF